MDYNPSLIVNLQPFEIPSNVLQEEWVSMQWRTISLLRGADELVKCSLIAQVMLGILSVPHSSGEW